MIISVPSFSIAAFSAVAGISWLMFARSQAGRYHSKILIWLSLPFFTLALIYLGFALSDPHDLIFDTRTMHARVGIVVIAVSQSVTLLVLSIINWGKHGK